MHIVTERTRLHTAWRAAQAVAARAALLGLATTVAGCVALPGPTSPAPVAAGSGASASPARPAAPAVGPVAAPAAVPVPAASAPAPTVAASPTGVLIRDPAPADVPAPPAEASLETAARAFYAYFDRVRQMPSAELAREFVRLDQPSNPTAVLELALALGQTRNPNDTVRALATLDPLLRSNDPQLAPWRPLARLLAARYNEQRRLEEQVERQSQQLREAQRRQEQLAQQLEALKAIERSLNTRPSTPPVAPPAAPAGANGTRPTPP